MRNSRVNIQRRYGIVRSMKLVGVAHGPADAEDVALIGRAEPPSALRAEPLHHEHRALADGALEQPHRS